GGTRSGWGLRSFVVVPATASHGQQEGAASIRSAHGPQPVAGISQVVRRLFADLSPSLEPGSLVWIQQGAGEGDSPSDPGFSRARWIRIGATPAHDLSCRTATLVVVGSHRHAPPGLGSPL